MKTYRLLSLVALASLCALSSAQADPATVSRIVDEGKNRNQVMKHLWYLTQNIGPRLTASPQLQKACEWTAMKFREYGLKNVRLEQWGEWPVGFERGKRQSVKMVAPYEKAFVFTTASWTPGTKGPVRAKAVLEPRTLAELEASRKNLRGAWMVSTRQQGGGRGAPPPTLSEEDTKVAEELAKIPIAGRVSASRNDLVITGGRWNFKWEDRPKEIRIVLRKTDMDTLLYQFERGRQPVLEVDIEQRMIKGPVPNYNVIADIPGTEKPDEMVIVSGHLDSWDGPGSQGTLDDGTGTMVALETARILMAAGAKPKRTIRFIMWTGEEQGLIGSRRYVEMHKDELSKISAVFVDDGGTNYQGGVTVTKEMEPMMREALAPAMAAFPDLPMEIKIAVRIPRGGGSDHASFNAVGVPGFFWFETGRSDYNYAHHTQHDKYELAIPEYLVQSSTNSAAASYIIASAATLLPRELPPTPPPSGGGGK
ncbi:MAG: M20/M25/M40 family metallo-hydrolase [Fimbriimonadaceae bacterium]